ncbi:MAG: aspartate ammonia-lyase [Treponema sp.]|jgi:aspartate ammonia-lyase|nr:aspartate ammonia-lyase [Treponema sp.]
MRKEHDGLGEVSLPDGVLYGIETARAAENFALGPDTVNPRLIRAMIQVKKAAALTFAELDGDTKESAAGHIPRRDKFRAIAAACDQALDGGAGGFFITHPLQGGAGTSTHMNVNEVLANLALRILGKSEGSYEIIHPLDDVNRLQSTNDVYPTALRIAAIEALRECSGECAKLQEALQKKENEYADIRKLGRTELMDAAPVTLGGEFGAFAQAVARDRWRLYKVEERLRQVNLGGSAVGDISPAGADPSFARRYRYAVIEKLRTITGMGLASAEYPMDLTQNNDVFVEVSGLLKSLAVNLSKIAGDLRLMGSGPRGGLGELKLAALQKGSTIMAGKVNPVIPEMIIQIAIRVMANDSAISMAASRGEFELNAFSPLIADSLLDSLEILARGCFLFRTKCVEILKPNPERCAELLAVSAAFAAGYVPLLGYETVSRIIAENADDMDAARAALEAACAPLQN